MFTTVEDEWIKIFDFRPYNKTQMSMKYLKLFFQLADAATEDASKVTNEYIATTEALEKEKSVLSSSCFRYFIQFE